MRLTTKIIIRQSLGWLISLSLVAFFVGPRPASGADEFEQPPINYSQTVPQNAVSQLMQRLEKGDAELESEPQFGYLRSILGQLKVPSSSQMLVFSKTSLQRDRISPRTPRAIYFNDDVYVGYCQQGEVLEISVADPQLGAVFYTLEQDASDKPRLIRQTDNCLLCHGSSPTQYVPGHLVRSVFADPAGQLLLSEGTYRTDHTSPFRERWGGWYVTGTHGSQKHLGNLIVRNRKDSSERENQQGQNVTDLTANLDTAKYLTPHSDLIALMLFEHQTQVHNYLTRANFLTRQALHYEETLNRDLKEPPGHRFASTTSRIKNAGEPLVEYLLLSGETKLTAPLAGTSTFAVDFPKTGPRDSRGRSLRDLDLQTRLLKYPCSYLVYSESFRQLPTEVKQYVLKRMLEILTSDKPDPKFAHLTAADRQAIREILTETLPDLPAEWQAQPR